jgi:hypothetical protein
MMSRARPELTDNLLLAAATTILVLAAQRYFEARLAEPAPAP